MHALEDKLVKAEEGQNAYNELTDSSQEGEGVGCGVQREGSKWSHTADECLEMLNSESENKN